MSESDPAESHELAPTPTPPERRLPEEQPASDDRELTTIALEITRSAPLRFGRTETPLLTQTPPRL